MKNSSPKAVILSDGKPGHFHQSIALCQHLGLEHEICEVDIPSRFHRVLSHVFDFFGIYSQFPFRLINTLPATDILISAGSRTYYANKTLSKKLKAKSVAILAPRGYRWNFDALLVPEYDNPPKQDNVIPLPINISFTQKDFILQKLKEFEERYTAKSESSPKVGILLGGDNKAGSMDPKEICDQLDNILQTHLSAEIWVTTSRRTPKQVEENLKSRSIDYLHLYSEEPYNPIPAFIHLCDHLYVTTDSTSMLSECVSSGNAQVSLIHTACSPKHQEMVKSLQRRNLIDTNQKINISESIHPIRPILNLHV